MSTIAGIILAAGESRRFGSPKALAPWNGRTFAEAVASAMREAGLEPRILVLGHRAQEITDQLRGIDARIVVNTNYTLGQFSSVRVGLSHLKDSLGAVIALVDQPQVSPSVFRRVRESLEISPERLVVPLVGNRRAHPVGIGACWFDEILAMPPTGTLRDFFARHERGITFLELDDESLLYDVDSPSDLEQLRSRAPWVRNAGHPPIAEERRQGGKDGQS